jgi:hypothetical protein
MTLVIQDRAGREPDRKITDTAEIATETRRLAERLGRDVSTVREDLVCGNTLRTVGAEYTLTD